MKKILNDKPLASWFLGPKAEHADTWTGILDYIFQDYIHWRRNYFSEDNIIVDRTKRRDHEIWFDKLNTEIDKLLNQLKNHYPFHSPRYIAHMLSEQSLPSVAGYFAGMLYNPNNVTEEAAPITVKLELEAGKMISEMLGYIPENSWSHITSGGTIANLEAMWVSRISQFIPLAIQEFCVLNKYKFQIKTPNGKRADISSLDKISLLKLRPNEAIFMPRKLAQFLIKDLKIDKSIVEEINKHLKNSKYNVKKKSYAKLISELGIEHKIFVSESAHYCFEKICGVLGIGEDSLELIPVDSRFRINIDSLKGKLKNLKENEIPLGVVGIVGTTEEGAIDPIHKIQEFRKELELSKKNQSFWFHIDAAWGGYFRSIIKTKSLSLNYSSKAYSEIFESYQNETQIEEDFKFYDKTMKADWRNPDLFYSLLAMKESDSITIDPHKLGYIPYPAGVICFKNGLVTELLTQKAQYISDDKGGMKDIDKPLEIKAIGPYILEGSKPGAAAAATYLAHKTIPLNNKGHGKIIRTTLLNSQKFYLYLSQHKKYFKEIEKEVSGDNNYEGLSFSFEPLFQPDSNLVCFIALPYVWSDNNVFTRSKTSLKKLNALNKFIHKELSISSEDKEKRIYSQQYFISKTELEYEQYKYNSIKELLYDNLKITRSNYKKYGLFILRSTIMNPWHYTAYAKNQDYLMGFLKHLHTTAKKGIAKIYSAQQ